MRRIFWQRSKTLFLVLALTPLTTVYAATITYQGPLQVNDAYVAAHGAVVKGNYQGTAQAPAITVSTSTPITIRNCNVTGPGDLIYATNANITVVNCNGVSTNPNVSGAQKGKFVHVEGAFGVDVHNNSIIGTSFGVYINSYKGSRDPSAQTIIITKNAMTNIDGRPSNGNGGYATSGQWNSHAIQLNQVQGVPNIKIAWNQVVNQPFQSQCGDIVNFYKSSGTSTSPIRIHDNYLYGAFPANPGVDNYSGGGIITDGTATDTIVTATAFVQAYNNQVVATANYGMSIATGHDNAFFNNTVVSSGFTASGAFYPMTYSNGLNNYNNYGQPASVMFNDMVDDNVSGLIKKGAGNKPVRSDSYLPNQSSGSNQSFMPNNSGSPTIADETSQYQGWQTKLKVNNIIIGSNSPTNPS